MSRSFTDLGGLHWEARIISAGRTSGYLNPKVHRPIIEFVCTSRRMTTRYAPLPAALGNTVDELSLDGLRELLSRARIH